MREKILKQPEVNPLHEKLEATITRMEEDMDFMHDYLKAILNDNIAQKYLVSVHAIIGDFLGNLEMERCRANRLQEPVPAESPELVGAGNWQAQNGAEEGRAATTYNQGSSAGKNQGSTPVAPGKILVPQTATKAAIPTNTAGKT